MVLTPEHRAELFRRFDSVLGERIERVFERAMLGEVTWDHDSWTALLDWIEGPLRRRMYTSWKAQNPDQAIEHAPAYSAFEGFDRARLQGQLDDSTLVRVAFSAIFEMNALMDDGLKFFGVTFRPATEVEAEKPALP